MAAQLAECYMLIMRPVPVLGEVWAKPFNGQIYIDEWDWTLSPKGHQEAAAPADAGGQAGAAAAPAPQPREGGGTPEGSRGAPAAPEPFDGRALAEEVSRLLRRTEAPQLRDRRVRELIARRAQEYNEGAVAAAASVVGTAGSNQEDKHNGLEFNFKKSTDLASSQMLYLLANNDLIPTVILTVFQRANSFPLTLIITMVNVRFTSCRLAAEAAGNETMTELTEAWEGTYEHISYAYHNRPPVGLPTSPFAALTQGRVKAFVMNPRGKLL